MKKISISKEDLICALTEILGSSEQATQAAARIEHKANIENEVNKKEKAKEKGDTKMVALVGVTRLVDYPHLEEQYAAFLQVPIRAAVCEVRDQVDAAIHAYNNSKAARKKKIKIDNISEGFRLVPRKYFKDRGITVKTKEVLPIYVTQHRE